MHNFFKNVFTVEKGIRKHSLIPLQNEEVDKRNLSIGSRVELTDSEWVAISMDTKPVEHQGWKRKRRERERVYELKTWRTCM